MTAYTIYHRENGRILFQTQAKSFKQALEIGVKENINFTAACLRHQNLSNANLDDGLFRGADFSYSNLNGANLSECDLAASIFSHATLYHCFLNLSDLSRSEFYDARFGDTDIMGATLNNCGFSSPSCFSLSFSHARAIRKCHFKTANGKIITFSKPPVINSGRFSSPVITIGEHKLIGNRLIHQANAHHFSLTNPKPTPRYIA